jgi:hypothetical protein
VSFGGNLRACGSRASKFDPGMKAQREGLVISIRESRNKAAISNGFKKTVRKQSWISRKPSAK